MSTLLLGSNWAGEAPQTSEEVRTTITTVDNDGSTAVAEHTPDWNTPERDPDTNGGLTSRAVADFVVPSERRVPDITNQNRDFSAPIDSQVSSSGHAAQRELEGHWGHGSGRYTVGIEPTIREGNQFNDVYFSAGRRGVQDGTVDYMTSARTPDSATAADQQAASKAAARRASENAMYQRFLDDRLGR